LLVGDFFALTPELLGPIDAVYDRAALIALPVEIRPRYVAVLRAVLPAGAPALVITLEYDQHAMTGRRSRCSRTSCARCMRVPRSSCSSSAWRAVAASARNQGSRPASAASRSGRTTHARSVVPAC